MLRLGLQLFEVVRGGMFRVLKRCFLAVLLVSAVLSVLVVPFVVAFFSSSSGGDSFVVVPGVKVSEGVDGNGNRVEDLLEWEVEQEVSGGNGTHLVDVVVLLSSAPSSSHLSVFQSLGGGEVRGPWRHALFGFAGRIPYRAVSVLAERCPNLLLVQKDYEYEAVMAYAARQGGVRPYVWNVLGYRGDSESSIAVSDTGIDDSHPNHGGFGNADFSKKIVGWRDDVAGKTTPYDDNGHGSHCAGIAGGSGFYSADADGRAVTTWSASLGSLDSRYIYLVTGFNVSRSGSGQKITLQAKGNRVDALYLYYSGFSANASLERVAQYSLSSSNVEYTFEYNVPEGKVGYYHVWVHGKAGGTAYLRVTIHWPFEAPQDGWSAWTGVAPDVRLVGLKGLNSAGSGSTSGLVSGIDWAVANRVTYHILVLSMSWGGGSYDSAIDNAVSNAVRSGIICVAAAGNSGVGGNYIHSPGSNGYAITVAATSVVDNVTSYSSQGGPSEAVSGVVKPDIAAPGGSFYYLPVFSTDSNDQDAENYYADFYPGDSAPMQGTSMSTPFIAGCAAVVAQALGGYAGWNYGSGALALQAKTLLLMTTTETFPNFREGEGASASPSLERGGKDVHEGYGRVNLDAAVEAAALTYSVGDVASASFGVSPLDKKCWARSVYLYDGVEYRFNLSVPAGADYDLYLYNATGDLYGEPVIVARSASAMLGGPESIAYTAPLSGKYYLIVKMAREDASAGQFVLSSSPAPSAHLLLTVEPERAVYAEGGRLTFTVDVFNRFNPAFEAALAVTVTGPGGYSFFDSEWVSVPADGVESCSFSWVVPEAAGVYVVEVGLVPPELAAYDSVWLRID